MGVIIYPDGQRAVEVVRDRPNVAIVQSPRPVIVQSGGLQGRPGAPGPSGAGYTHTQATESATWNIPHNLGYRPAVELYDAGGQEFDADVAHLNENTVVVTIAIPVAGFARLN